MKHLFSLVFAGLSTFGLTAQVPNAAANLKRQAQLSGNALIKGDYKTFGRYLNPAILKQMGGEANMEAAMGKIVEGMKQQGVTFSKITVEDPAPVIKKGSELQTTVVEHTELKMAQGRMVSTQAMIAVSEDNGVNWTFIDVSNKDVETIKKMIPNLSSTIKIPATPAPVRYNN